MSIKSPFAIQKALIEIGGEPKSVKRCVRGSANRNYVSFTNLNSCRGVISEPDLLGTSDSEILEGLLWSGVTRPTLPQTIKAGYLNCKIRPYIRILCAVFQCQRFGRSAPACRGQLTCSRCASVGHASSDLHSRAEIRQLFTATSFR
ncbi:RNA-directed DNA polymerase from mobile element jockey [Trichonephila clavipes]|nr:RNA-directed DNA polymerase from mobile element jockey [Trichonephila clavipes]